MADNDKRRLQKTVEALQLRFGPRTIRRLGKDPNTPARLSTGFHALDRALGGGLPRGRITEVIGVPTAGMATLVLKIVAQAQAAGERAVWIDLEQTFDPDYAARCGLILDRLLLVRPPDVPQALKTLAEFVAGDVAIVVCDLYRFEPAVASTARALSAALEQILTPLGKSSTVLICLISLSPGVALETYAHKVALPYYATVRLELQRERWLQRRRDIYGYRARILIAKNKLGPAGVSLKVDIAFDDNLQGDRS